MFLIIEVLVILYAMFFCIRHGLGKEKLWALAPIGAYFILGNLYSFVGAIMYGPENWMKIQESPITLAFAIFNMSVIIGGSIWIVNKIKLANAVRAAESDD